MARDLTDKDVCLRAAEVYIEGDKHDDIKTGFKGKDRLGFELGLKDINGFRLWVHSDAVGGLSRPYYRGNPNGKQPDPPFYRTKTMLETLRFPSECYKRQGPPRLDIKKIIAILIRPTNLVGKRALAFDDLQILQKSI